MQPQISSTKTHCELEVQQPFFETSQSCVSTTVTLSHRFKAFSPPFCAKSRFRHVPSENFAEIFFDRALNRPRSPEVRKPLACFLVLFARCKKNVKTSPLQGASRFSRPRISAYSRKLCTNQLNPFETIRCFANLDPAHIDNDFAQTKLNPFSALRRCPCLGGSTPCVLLHTFCKAQKVCQKSLPAGSSPPSAAFFGGFAAFRPTASCEAPL